MMRLYDIRVVVTKTIQLERIILRSFLHRFATHKDSDGDYIRYFIKSMRANTHWSFCGLRDNIATKIWERLDVYGDSVKAFFDKQMHRLECKNIRVEGGKT